MNKLMLTGGKGLFSEILDEIVKKIISIANPEKIILFGSYVYGIPDRESDIDLLIIKGGIKSKIEEYSRIRRSLKGIRLPFDIIVITPEEFEFYSHNWKNSVVAEARSKGIIIYGD